MTLTREYLEEYFRKFNEDYFEGSLPIPRIALSRSRTRLGSMACKRKLTLRGFRLTDFTIRISTYYDFTERQAQNVLLHEMIHYYIAYHKLRDTSSHGTLFRKIMNTLNSVYGWDITISSPTTGMKRNEIKKDKTYLILVMRTADRKTYISVVNPKYSQEIEQRINNVNHLIKREQRKLVYSAERENGGMKSNLSTKPSTEGTCSLCRGEERCAKANHLIKREQRRLVYSAERENGRMKFNAIIWHKWFTSQDSFFTDMPAVRSLRGRKITEVKLQELLPKMREEKQIFPL